MHLTDSIDTDAPTVPRRRPQASTSHFSQTLSIKERDRLSWSRPRKMMAKIVEHKCFECFMGFVICMNVTGVVVEVHLSSECHGEYMEKLYHQGADVKELEMPTCEVAIFNIFNTIFLVIYIVELCMRMFTYRKTFFHTKWNNADGAIVFVGILDAACEIWSPLTASGRTVLKLLRMCRLVRAIRLLSFFPDLFKLVQLLMGAMTPLAWGILLLILMIVFWSVICLEFISPYAYAVDFGEASEQCHRQFVLLWPAMLFFFQLLVLADDWGTCVKPMIEHVPWSVSIFTIAIVTVQLGFMNLILTAIVDHASAARERDHEARAAQARHNEKRVLEDWRRVFDQMDRDHDGTVSFLEFKRGFEHEESVRQYLEGLDITSNDIDSLFELLDTDGSGELCFDELVNNMAKAQSQNKRIYMMTMKLQIDQLVRLVREQADELVALRSFLGGGGEDQQQGVSRACMQEVQSASESEQAPCSEGPSSPSCRVANIEPLCVLAEAAAEQPPAVALDNTRCMLSDEDSTHGRMALSLRAAGCDEIRCVHSGGNVGSGIILLPVADKKLPCTDAVGNEEYTKSHILAHHNDLNPQNLDNAAGLKCLEEQLCCTKASLARGFEEILLVLASHTRQLDQLVVDRSKAGRTSATAAQSKEGASEHQQPVSRRWRLSGGDTAPLATQVVTPPAPVGKSWHASCGDHAAGPTTGSRARLRGPGCIGVAPAGGHVSSQPILHAVRPKHDPMVRLSEALTPRGMAYDEDAAQNSSAVHRVSSQHGSRASGLSNESRHYDSTHSSGMWSPSSGRGSSLCKPKKRQFFL